MREFNRGDVVEVLVNGGSGRKVGIVVAHHDEENLDVTFDLFRKLEGATVVVNHGDVL